MDIKSLLGYSKGSPFRGRPYIDINTPNGIIDMSNTDIPLMGIDETGAMAILPPRSGRHKFRGKKVREVPMGYHMMPDGTMMSNNQMQMGGLSEAVDWLFEEDDVQAPPQPQPETVEDIHQGQVGASEMYDMSNALAMEVAQRSFSPRVYRGRRGNTYRANSSNSDPFAGIFRVEGAKTGQPTNLKSSAIGRGQMIKGTRELMYKKLGISDIQAAEQRFKTDPDFEMQVLNAYREDLDARIPEGITGKQREYMIAKGWYTGNPFFPDDVVPGKSAGNRLTAGEYARRAIK